MRHDAGELLQGQAGHEHQAEGQRQLRFTARTVRAIDDCAKKVRWKSNVVQATGTTALGIARFVHAAMPL